MEKFYLGLSKKLFHYGASLSPRARAAAAAGILGLPDSRGRWVSLDDLGAVICFTRLGNTHLRKVMGGEWTHACAQLSKDQKAVWMVFLVCVCVCVCVYIYIYIYLWPSSFSHPLASTFGTFVFSVRDWS